MRILFFLLTMGCHPLQAQVFAQQDLDRYNLRTQQITRNGMYALTAWGAANVVSGAIAAPLTTGEMRYFHIMNASWNVVNLAIGIPGIIASSRKEKVMGFTLGKTLQRQQQQEQLYLINAGLDLAYMGIGTTMWGFANRTPKHAQMMTGLGYSLLLQGGFLLVFDWTMYWLHKQHAGKKLHKYVSGLTYTGMGISYRVNF